VFTLVRKKYSRLFWFFVCFFVCLFFSKNLIQISFIWLGFFATSSRMYSWPWLSKWKFFCWISRSIPT
jgi:hypothetical protein